MPIDCASIASIWGRKPGLHPVNAKGWNVLPSCPVKANTGMNDSRMIITEKKIGRPTMRHAGMMISRVSPVIFL